MKKPLDNKGFTLLEMVVAFAILAVVMTTVTLVISTSSNTYTKISTDINLQYESQLAMSQLQEYTIDCNGYLAVNGDKNVLYIFNKVQKENGGTAYQAYKFEKKADSDELYFYKKPPMDTLDPDDAGIFSFGGIVGQPMSSYVESFSADVSASSVTFTVAYKVGGEKYNAKQTFALRNTPNVIVNGVPQA